MKHENGASPVPKGKLAAAHAACSPEAVAARMLSVVGDSTLRDVAADCGIHRETARRYLHGQTPPSLVFVAVFADRYGISLEWLMCGRGPMYRSMLRQHHLAEASIQDVCMALGAGVERALRQGGTIAAEDAQTRARWRGNGALDAAGAGPKLVLDRAKQVDLG